MATCGSGPNAWLEPFGLLQNRHCLGFAAKVILTPCAEVMVAHLGEDDRLCGAVDVDQKEAVEIRGMTRRGEGVRSIAKQLSCSRSIVRRYLQHDVHARTGTKALFQPHAIGPQTKGARRAGRDPQSEGNVKPTGGDRK